MDTQNVLIPGGGGAAGIGAIKSLRMSNFKGNIISTDSNKLSAGLYLADKGYTVPPAINPCFFKEVMKIIEDEEIQVIFPTSGFDVIPYSKNKKKLLNTGVIPVVSDYEVLDTCLNKYKFYCKLKDHFNLPYTTTSLNIIPKFPCVIKPIYGKGSQNIFICNNEGELHDIFSKYPHMLVQECLPGKEYTIDVLSDLNGNPILAVPRERVEIKAGISSKGRIVVDKNMQNECMHVAEFLGIKGPSCMQMKCDCDGVPRIMEVNPRMGGATIMATYAGVNFPELILKIVNEELITVPPIKNISMIRYYNEIILDENERMVKK